MPPLLYMDESQIENQQRGALKPPADLFILREEEHTTGRGRKTQNCFFNIPLDTSQHCAIRYINIVNLYIVQHINDSLHTFCMQPINV